jgi:hypothetical protein
VIPTSFPATTAAASGPVTGMAPLLPELRSARTLTHYLLAGARQGVTACSGGGGIGDHDRCRGGVAAASIPVTRSAIWYCLLCRCCFTAYERVAESRRHPSEAQPGPACFARRRRLREHRVGHGLSGRTGAGNAIVTERGHMTRPQPDTSGALPTRSGRSLRRPRG